MNESYRSMSYMPQIDQTIVDNCLELANGDIAKVAVLLAKSVGPLNYDDEDNLLNSSDSYSSSQISENDSSHSIDSSEEEEIEIMKSIHQEEIKEDIKEINEMNYKLPESLQNRWKQLKQNLSKDDLQTIEEVMRLQLHAAVENVLLNLFE